MRSGTLRHELTIQARSDSAVDALGQPVEAWTDVESRRASINPLSGRDLQQARQVVEDVTHEIRMRYVDYLTPEHRLREGTSRFFHVRYVLNPGEKNRESVIYGVERV